MPSWPEYSLVVPIYNEEETIPELVRRLAELVDKLDGEAEVILVDDGSSDRSYELMSAARDADPRFKLLRLSRNFGHQIAVTAGLDVAAGNAVIVMDADLQDPPEVALELAARWRDGYEVVYAVREGREGETPFKRATASLFYRAVPPHERRRRPARRRRFPARRPPRARRFPIDAGVATATSGACSAGSGTARSVSRSAETSATRARRSTRSARCSGSRPTASSASRPIRCGLRSTSGSSCLGAVVPARRRVPVSKFAGFYSVPGLASVAVFVAFLGGIQLLLIGIMGEYVARIHDEVKGRPLYLVSDTQGLEPPRVP